MYQIQNVNQLTNAIHKARRIHPRVKAAAFGTYQVSTGKRFHTVTVEARRVHCTCLAGEFGHVCYHSVAALSLHVYLAQRPSPNCISDEVIQFRLAEAKFRKEWY